MRLDDAIQEHEAWLTEHSSNPNASRGRLVSLLRALGPERDVASITVDDMRVAERTVSLSHSWRTFWRYAMSRGYVTDPAAGWAVHERPRHGVERLSDSELEAVLAFEPRTYEQHVGITLLALALCGVSVLVLRYLTTDMARLDWHILAYNASGGGGWALDGYAVRRLRAWLEVRTQRGEQRALFTTPEGKPLSILDLRAILAEIERAAGVSVGTSSTGITYVKCWRHWRRCQRAVDRQAQTRRVGR